MQDLIELRVRTISLKRRVETHWPPGQHEGVVEMVREKSDAISGYLKGISLEYERGYKPVSYQQRIDEAVVTRQIGEYSNCLASRRAKGRDELQLRWTAWAQLTDQGKLPCLSDLHSEADDWGYEW